MAAGGLDLRQRPPYLPHQIGQEQGHGIRARRDELTWRDHRYVGCRHTTAMLGARCVGNGTEQAAIDAGAAEQGHRA